MRENWTWTSPVLGAVPIRTSTRRYARWRIRANTVGTHVATPRGHHRLTPLRCLRSLDVACPVRSDRRRGSCEGWGAGSGPAWALALPRHHGPTLRWHAIRLSHPTRPTLGCGALQPGRTTAPGCRCSSVESIGHRTHDRTLGTPPDAATTVNDCRHRSCGDRARSQSAVTCSAADGAVVGRLTDSRHCRQTQIFRGIPSNSAGGCRPQYRETPQHMTQG